MAVLPQDDLDKLSVLANFVSPSIFQHIEECTEYEAAVRILQALFVKPRNEIFARHLLVTRCQQPHETLDEFLQSLKTLSKNCNFQSVTASKYCEESIRDAFITGLRSPSIRQRLLENNTLDLKTMFDQARSLELAMRNSESYASPPLSVNAAVPLTATEDQEQIDSGTLAAVGSDASTCFFCGNSNHPRSRCPARDAVCSKCQKKGHFAKVCRSKKISKNKVSAAAWSPTLATVGAPESLSKSLGTVTVEGLEVKALFDSGSTESFIHPRLVEKAAFTIHPSSGTVSMATTVSSTVSITGTCTANLTYQGREYAGYRLSVLPGLCADLILGLDFQSQHSSVTYHYGGSEPPLAICGFSTLNIDPPEPFANLAANCHPIASKSRRYSRDSAFIDEEVKRLLKEGIIEPSLSPWRAQVVVTKDENHRKRLAIDYSQTINRFTLLDAFPFPRITDMVNKIAQYRVFSTIDLRSAYHQVPLKEEDKLYTAFETRGNLYQFTRLPFGVTNGVACFQREMMKFVDENGLEASFPYLDNVTICSKDQEDHDANLKQFLEAAKRKNLCYNTEKCIFSTRCLPIFGYIIEEGTIRPDPDRLRPLRELPIPHDPRSMSRCLGLFSYNSQWIPKFSDRIKPIASCKTFPLPPPAVEAFESLKKTIEDAVVTAIDKTIPFEVASIEKEAQAIIETVRHWRHFLAGRHFILKTDQKSVSCMFDKQHRGKIKNEKFLRWRLELSCFSFDIVYRPGRDNVPADTLSRAMCAMATEDSLFKLHEALCHPGITRLNHFVRTKNLPYSLEEIKKMTSRCPVCCECRPQFHRPEKVPLIKATQPFERINIDFKGPLPTNNGNKFLLMVVDEYSRFLFVFPCPDVSTNTVIKCLTSLLSLVGMPAYVH